MYGAAHLWTTLSSTALVDGGDARWKASEFLNVCVDKGACLPTVDCLVRAYFGDSVTAA